MIVSYMNENIKKEIHTLFCTKFEIFRFCFVFAIICRFI